MSHKIHCATYHQSKEIGVPHRTPTVCTLMKEYLSSRGMPSDLISMEDGSVSTATNMRNIDKESSELFVVTSWYHCWRSKRLLRRFTNRKIETISVFPPLTWSCLSEEYFMNMILEPLKIIVDFFPSMTKVIEKNEKKIRQRK